MLEAGEIEIGEWVAGLGVLRFFSCSGNKGLVKFYISVLNGEVNMEMYVRRSGRERKAWNVAASIMGAEGWKAEVSGRGKRSWM